MSAHPPREVAMAGSAGLWDWLNAQDISLAFTTCQSNRINGNNLLDGSTGADTMVGRLGNDTYVVDNEGDIVSEAASVGTDQINSSVTRTLSVNLENRLLTGAAAINGTGNTGNNLLDGLAGNDSLSGGDGDDILTAALTTTPFGRNEIDTLTGGTGADHFVLGVSTSVLYDNGLVANPCPLDYALITDFTPAQFDKLHLNGAAAQYLLGTSPIAGVPGKALYYDTNGNGTLQSGTDELIAIIRSPAALTTANTIATPVFV